MKGLALAMLFPYSKRRGSKSLWAQRKQRGRWELVYVPNCLELGMLNLRCMGDNFVEIPSQQFEAQNSFRCRLRVRQHNR